MRDVSFLSFSFFVIACATTIHGKTVRVFFVWTFRSDGGRGSSTQKSYTTSADYN